MYPQLLLHKYHKLAVFMETNRNIFVNLTSEQAKLMAEPYFKVFGVNVDGYLRVEARQVAVDEHVRAFVSLGLLRRDSAGDIVATAAGQNTGVLFAHAIAEALSTVCGYNCLNQTGRQKKSDKKYSDLMTLFEFAAAIRLHQNLPSQSVTPYRLIFSQGAVSGYEMEDISGIPASKLHIASKPSNEQRRTLDESLARLSRDMVRTGSVHGDLKMSNFVVTPEMNVKLIDPRVIVIAGDGTRACLINRTDSEGFPINSKGVPEIFTVPAFVEFEKGMIHRIRRSLRRSRPGRVHFPTPYDMEDVLRSI